MTRSLLARLLFTGLVLTMPAIARAESHYTVNNGATCIPYPHADSTTAARWLNVLYGFKNMAFCHVAVPNGWSVAQLSYMLYTVHQGGTSPMRISLCVADAYGGSPNCGTEKTTSSGLNVNWVSPPSPVPAAASVAFLMIRFPPGEFSRVFEVIPVFYRP